MKKILKIIILNLLWCNIVFANIVDEITKLNNLYKEGAITKEEFNKAKEIIFKSESTENTVQPKKIEKKKDKKKLLEVSLNSINNILQDYNVKGLVEPLGFKKSSLQFKSLAVEIINNLQKNKLQLKIYQLILVNKLSVRKTEELVRNLNKQKRSIKKEKSRTNNLEKIESKLSENDWKTIRKQTQNGWKTFLNIPH